MSNKKYSVTIGISMPTDNLRKSSRDAMSLIDRMVQRQLESVKSLIAADRARGASHERLMRQMTQSEQVVTAAINRETRAATQIYEREARRTTQIRTQQTREAEREIRRFERERQQTMRASEQAIARLAKQESDTRIREGRRAAREIERSLNQVRATSEHTAKDSGSSFSTFLGASFFGNLAANAVSAFFSKAKDFIPESTRLAAETQNALKGLTSVSLFKGIDQSEAEVAVKSLRFVRGGIISIGDASVSVKNLLSTGFGLKQSIDLMERFSDASAFGKQSALDYGDAIRGASEGIKNQNSILVDNVGITKNLSVILKERGFQLEDLSDKTKGLAAREALYAGLLAESQAQVGDADKLMQGYTGTIAAQDTAYQNLQRAIGDIIITHPALIASNQIVTEQINETTSEIQRQGTEAGKLADTIITEWARIKASTLPFMAGMKNAAQAAIAAELAIFTATRFVILRTSEVLVDQMKQAVASIVNIGIEGVNKVNQISERLTGRSIFSGSIQPFVPAPTDFGARGAKTELDVFAKMFSQSVDRFDKTIEESREIDRRIDAARELRDYQRRFSPELVRRIDQSANEGRLAESRAFAEELGGGGGKARKAAAEKLTDIQSIERSAERGALKALLDLGKQFGFVAGMNQSAGAHNKGSLHPLGRALDFSVKGKSASEISRFIEELTAVGYTVFDERTRPKGQKVWGGPHLHAQFGAGGLNKALAQDAFERQSNPFIGLTPPQIVQIIATTQRGVQPKSRVPLTLDTPEGASMIELPIAIQRQWDLYYNDAGNREKALHDRRLDYAAEIEVAQRDMLTSIGNVESDLEHLRAQNADDQFSEQRRLLAARSEEFDLLKRITATEDERANGPLNKTLRIQLALLEDINQIRRRDEDAIKSQNRSMLELADAEIFHGEQARANVLDHLSRARTQTEVFSDAIISSYEAINDVVFRGVQKITGGISILDNLIAGLITRITNRLFQKLLDVLIPGGSSSQNQQSAGGSIVGSLTGGFGGGRGGGGLLGNLFGGGSITSPQSAQASLLSRIFGGGGSMTAPASLSAAGGSWASVGAQLGSGQLANAAQLTGPGGMFSGGGLGGMLAGPGMMGALGGMLPLLGVGLGASLGVGAGGQSGLGQVLGGLGGALGGGALGLLGFTALGGTFSSPALVAMLGVLGPAALIAAPLLIAGAIILKKNKERQLAEQVRNTAGIDTRTAIYQLLAEATAGRATLSMAKMQFEEIHQNYLSKLAPIKDDKTRRNALLWWDHIAGISKDPGGATVALWPMIELAAIAGEKRQNDLKRMTPVFAHGGINQMNQLIRVSRGEGVRGPGSNMVNVVPGQFQGREDTEFMFAPRGTEIIPRSRMSGARGFANGTDGDWNPNIDIKINIDKDGMAEAVITSPRFKTAVIRNFKIGRLEKKI